MHDRLSVDISGPLVAFAGGGTGGHLFPAVALATAIQARIPSARFHYYATQRPIDAHILGGVRGESIPQPIPRLSKLPWKWPKILRSLKAALSLVRGRFDVDLPTIVIGTGGLASIPAMWEATRHGIATAILNPDAIPGRANRWLSRYADAVYTQWAETTEHLPHSREILVYGCPVRPEFGLADRPANPAVFDLISGRRTLLITGASQGARTINDAVLAIADRLSADRTWQILHLAGEFDFERVRDRYATLNLPARVLRFTDRMADAIRIADVVISRAGASTLAELTAMARASVLMPYPHHRDQHQEANALCLVRRGAAVLVRDRADTAADAPVLAEALSALMADGSRCSAVAEAARNMGRVDAADRIADHLIARAISRKALARRESLQVMYGGTR